ncbi:MAG: LysR family transcriptional regulator [Paracoccaceae bacterium]
MQKTNEKPTLRLRINLPDGSYLGPGKADLMAGIAETGSILAAGRRMGMSYKRAWGLVETLNSMFDMPLVQANRGGASRGGAALTDRGTEVLALYRAILATSEQAAAASLASLLSHAASTTPDAK